MAQLVLVLTDLNFRCSPLEERSSEENQRPAFLGKLRRRHRALRGLYFGLNLALLQLLLQLFFYSDNLLVFFASFEASVLPIFLLMGFFGKRSQKFRAMAYLLFFTLLSALPLLLLLLELYQRSGTVHYGALLALQASGRLLSSAELPWAFMAFFLPFGVKMAWFPLHGWLPEAHVEASTEGSMLLSGVLLKVGFYGLLRCCLGLCGGAAAGLAPYLLTPALVGATIASLSAYRQLDLKKIIAYSSVVHMNLSLMGCFCLSSTALSAALLLNFGHAVVSAGLFAAVGALENRTRTRNLLELSGLDGVMPNWCLALLLLLLANAGFPGTVGFLGEAGLLWGCYQSFVWTPTLALPAVGLMGLRCLLLYAQLAWGVPAPFLNPTRLPELQSFPTHERLLLLRHWDVGYRRDGLVLTLLAGLSLLLGLWPQPLLVLLEQPALLLAGWGALPTTAVVGCINHLYLYAGANPALARVVPLSLTPYPLPLIPYPLSLTPYPLFLIPYSLSLTILTPYTLPPMPVFRTNQTNFNHQHPLLRPLATTAAPETKATETRKILAAQVPATLTTLERLARYRELGLPVPQRSPRLLRLLVISPAGEAQRAHLPLQKVTHPFFMAPYSEYPLLLGFSLLGVLGGTVNYLHHGFMGLASEPYLLLLLLVTLRWCGDLESLGNQPALYTAAVRRNLLLGIMLFILSEIMIFFALFWAFFHSALNPSAELGSVWPPLKLLLLE
jgi:proton-translocating NADH-quinone oxidoreductase chain M